MYWRRQSKEERVGEAAASLLLMKLRELDHLTLRFESLPYNTKGKILIHVKTLDDSLSGASLVKCNF